MDNNSYSLFQGQIQNGQLNISKIGKLAETYNRIRIKVVREDYQKFIDPFSGFAFRISSHSPAYRSF